MYTLTGRTADDVWRAAADLFVSDGLVRTQPGRGGDTLELLHTVLEIEDSRQRWAVSRTPPINPAFALVEALWIVAGRRDAALPLFWNPRLARFCGDTAEYGGAYGYRLRSHFGVDQLDRVYRALSASAETRQAVLQLWDASADLPNSEGLPVRADVPCNVVCFPKLRGGRLEWMQVLRSNDLFLGLPYNMVQFTVLQEILAGWIGVAPGAYCQLSDSLHVYLRDVVAVRASVDAVTVPQSTDSFAVAPRVLWDSLIVDVMRRLQYLTLPSLTEAELRALALAGDAPTAYENAIRVAAADSARRRGWNDLATLCGEAIADPCLQCMWSRWRARVGEVDRAHRTIGGAQIQSAV